MQQCSKCDKEKPLTDFSNRKSRKGEIQKHRICKPCLTQGKKEWLHNKQQELRSYIFNYLLDKQCVICGLKDILVLEFDHRNPKEKSFNIGKACAGKDFVVKLDELIAEVAKCDVMCRNCHQRKTHEDNKSWRYQMAKENTSK